MKRNIYKMILGVLIGLILAFSLTACSQKPPQQVQKAIDPRTYITPNDPDVQNILPQIITHKAFWRPDFGAIQVWVDKNVTYIPDKDDYWQKSNETLKRRKGDCEDYAILLCTLLRAYEVPAKDVYVAIGRNSEGKGHAYLIEDWYKGKWRVIEPQDGGLFTTDAAASETARTFDVEAVFNDTSYEGKPFWLSQILATPETTTPRPNIMPTFTINNPLNVTFNGWYVNGNSVKMASKNSAISIRISLSGGESGQYEMQIIRDVNLANDEVVKELTFNYDGISGSQEISFSPNLATKESNTNGYQVSLIKNGTSLWTLANSYPPRLRVTSK